MESDTIGVTSTKIDFWPKIRFFWPFFFGKRAVSPSILARTQKSSITINIFGKMKSRAIFVILGPKLRVVPILSRYSPKMAKFGMSLGKWPIPRKRNFFSGWVQWESCSPRSTGEWWSVLLTKIAIHSKTKSWLLALNIKILGSNLHIFVPGAAGQYFQYDVSPIWGYQKFCSLLPNF